MSCLVTRPAKPVPGMVERSSWWSAAILRTSGVERRRSRSSAVSSPSPWGVGPACGDGTAGAAATRGAGGLEPARGAPPAAAGDGAGGAAVGPGAAGAGAAAAAGATGAAALGVGREAAGGAAAPAAGFAAAPCAVSITATSVWTGTVWPSVTLISARTPAAGAGISASTLSVEISNNGSSRFTASPTCLSHLLNVPSAMDSPIWGINTSTRAMGSPRGGVAVAAGRAQLGPGARDQAP